MLELAAEFWRWWIGQLIEIVPGARGRAGRRSGVLLIIEPELSLRPGPPLVRAQIERRGKTELVGRFFLDRPGLDALKSVADANDRSLEIHLKLPHDAMLETRVVLPLAAERNLARVLEYEIDHETPFEPDEIYWHSIVEQRDRVHRRLALRLVMVAKAQLSDLFEYLATIDLIPTLLIGTGRDGTRTLIEVNHDQRRPRELLDLAIPAAGWLCAALVVAVVAAPFLRQSLTFAAVDRQIAKLQPAVAEVEQLEHRAQFQRQLIEPFTAAHNLDRDPLEILAAITAALPDDTHLSALEFTKGKLVMTGLSTAAAKLIGLISQSPALRQPVFSAPVRRIDRSGYDIFSITAAERR
jgi:general secretion pathway protein L